MAICRGLFLGTETTKTKREQPKPRREWQYNAEKHKGKASASRVPFLLSKGLNFEVMLIERVVVVYNAVNEFANSDKKIKYSVYILIQIIIDFVMCSETSESDSLCRSFLKHHNLLD